MRFRRFIAAVVLVVALAGCDGWPVLRWPPAARQHPSRQLECHRRHDGRNGCR